MSKSPKQFQAHGNFDDFMRHIVLDEDMETPMELPSTAVGRQRSEKPSVSELDLTNYIKAVFMIGRGYHGKSVLARKLMEDTSLSGRQAFCAACDPGNRSLLQYMSGINQPPSSDTLQTAKWIEKSLSFIRDAKQNAMYDLGAGGDNALLALTETVPDLDGRLKDWGIVPVLMYVLGPNSDSLVSLTTFENRGFQPPTTALIYNEFLASAGGDKRESFNRLRLQSSVQRAVARGAVESWMPALDGDAMAEIERKRFLFRSAAAGNVRSDRVSTPLGGFARARITRWLNDFDYEFGPIRGWLP